MSRSYRKSYNQKYPASKSKGRDSKQMFHKAYRSMVRHSLRACKDYDDLALPQYNEGWDMWSWPDWGGGYDSYLDALQYEDTKYADHNFYYWEKKDEYISRHDKFGYNRYWGVEGWKRRRRK